MGEIEISVDLLESRTTRRPYAPQQLLDRG